MPLQTGVQALSSCPAREDLFAFSVGDLSQELREAFAAHIEGCGMCLAALQARPTMYRLRRQELDKQFRRR